MKNRALCNTVKIVKLLIIILSISICQSITNSSNVKVINDNLNMNLDLTAMAKLVESNAINSIYIAKDSYVGDLTGYTADCPLCGGKLACMPELDVLNGNVEYNDVEYGKVKIVASSKNLPCGSIVRFASQKISDTPSIAVVLDRGVGSNNLDLLVSSYDTAISIGRATVNYDVLREGWKE